MPDLSAILQHNSLNNYNIPPAYTWNTASSDQSQHSVRQPINLYNTYYNQIQTHNNSNNPIGLVNSQPVQRNYSSSSPKSSNLRYSPHSSHVSHLCPVQQRVLTVLITCRLTFIAMIYQHLLFLCLDIHDFCSNFIESVQESLISIKNRILITLFTIGSYYLKSCLFMVKCYVLCWIILPLAAYQATLNLIISYFKWLTNWWINIFTLIYNSIFNSYNRLLLRINSFYCCLFITFRNILKFLIVQSKNAIVYRQRNFNTNFQLNSSLNYGNNSINNTFLTSTPVNSRQSSNDSNNTNVICCERFVFENGVIVKKPFFNSCSNSRVNSPVINPINITNSINSGLNSNFQLNGPVN